MAKTHPDWKLAKSTCDAGELEVIHASLPAQLATWSRSDLSRWQSRARVLRDKWRDVSRSQERKTQRTLAQRQHLANARSQEKARLFDNALSRITDQIGKVPAADSQGTGPTKTPRSDRKISNRAARSTTKSALKSTTKEINRKAREHERAATDHPSISSETVAPAAPIGNPPVAKTNVKKPNKKQKSKPKSTGGVKTPEITKSRKRMLARQDAIAFQHEKDQAARKETKKDHATSPARPGVVGRQNTAAKEKAHRNRMAVSGSRKIQAHVTAANRRAQARRDSK